MPNMQMNFRIDAELKRRGDERFARFGCTPSEALRRLYEVTSLQAQREALGIPPAAPPQEFSDEYWDNLFYEAKTERLAERGLW